MQLTSLQRLLYGHPVHMEHTLISGKDLNAKGLYNNQGTLSFCLGLFILKKQENPSAGILKISKKISAWLPTTFGLTAADKREYDNHTST